MKSVYEINKYLEAFKTQLMRDRSHFTPVYKSEGVNYESRRPITAMQLKSLVCDGFTRLGLTVTGTN